MNHLTLLGVALNAAAVLAVTGFFSRAGNMFGPKSKRLGDADMAYETGLPPLSAAHAPMTVLYHRFAVLFVVFDVDLAFLLPWVLNRKGLDFSGVCTASAFVLLLLMMLAYFWRKGSLDCR